ILEGPRSGQGVDVLPSELPDDVVYQDHAPRHTEEGQDALPCLVLVAREGQDRRSRATGDLGDQLDQRGLADSGTVCLDHGDGGVAVVRVTSQWGQKTSDPGSEVLATLLIREREVADDVAKCRDGKTGVVLRGLVENRHVRLPSEVGPGAWVVPRFARQVTVPIHRGERCHGSPDG